jgi:hypothetical protein
MLSSVTFLRLATSLRTFFHLSEVHLSNISHVTYLLILVKFSVVSLISLKASMLLAGDVTVVIFPVCGL